MNWRILFLGYQLATNFRILCIPSVSYPINFYWCPLSTVQLANSQILPEICIDLLKHRWNTMVFHSHLAPIKQHQTANLVVFGKENSQVQYKKRKRTGSINFPQKKKKNYLSPLELMLRFSMNVRLHMVLLTHPQPLWFASGGHYI